MSEIITWIANFTSIIGVGIGALLAWLASRVRAIWSNTFGYTRRIKSGIYKNKIYDHHTKKYISTAPVYLKKKFFGGIIIYPLYRSKSIPIFHAWISVRNKKLLEGNWRRIDEPNYLGEAVFRYEHKNQSLSGLTLGTTSDDNVSLLSWNLKRTKVYNRPVFSKSLFIPPLRIGLRNPHLKIARNTFYARERKRLKELNIDGAPVRRIIDAHKNRDKGTFEFEGDTYSVAKGISNPEVSTTSIKIWAAAKTHIKSGSAVLDIGTGCGLYAILAKKSGAERVVATDLKSPLPCAIGNASKILGEDHQIEFLATQSRDKVYTALEETTKPIPKEFDIILANIPFSLIELNKEYKHSEYINSFATSEAMIFQLIVNAEQYLKPGGSLFYASGQTAPEKLYESIYELTDLQHSQVSTFNSTYSGRVYYVNRLQRVAPAPDLTDLAHRME